MTNGRAWRNLMTTVANHAIRRGDRRPFAFRLAGFDVMAFSLPAPGGALELRAEVRIPCASGRDGSRVCSAKATLERRAGGFRLIGDPGAFRFSVDARPLAALEVVLEGAAGDRISGRDRRASAGGSGAGSHPSVRESFPGLHGP